MGRLIAIEGLDGAGKRTLTDRLHSALTSRGVRARRLAFPRYGTDIHADLARDALHGDLGDVATSVYAMALLFALDRRAAAAELRVALDECDVLLVDRYVASNAAYGAARLHQGADGGFVAWVRALEIERFGLPTPNHQILLAVPVGVAAERALRRECHEPQRRRDAYESDPGLQERTGSVYAQLAARAWLSPWTVLDGADTIDIDQVMADIVN